MALNIDDNLWYQVIITSDDVLSLASTNSQSGHGAVFFEITNITSPRQQWQIWNAKDGTYVLRSQESGPNFYVTTQADKQDTEDNSGSSTPGTTLYTHADQSMYWTIGPWGDGSFFLTNRANGTNWHLEKKPNALMAMSSNTTAPQPGQSFLFKALTKIDDQSYSTVQVCSQSDIDTFLILNCALQTFPASSTAPTTAPTSKSSGSTTTSTSSGSTTGTQHTSSESSGKLSAGAVAGIGAGVGILSLLAIAAAILFLVRRRSRNSSRKPDFNEYKAEYIDMAGPGISGTHSNAAELPISGPAVELDAGQHNNTKVIDMTPQEPVQLP
jgi:hypothetical protein